MKSIFGDYIERSLFKCIPNMNYNSLTPLCPTLAVDWLQLT